MKECPVCKAKYEDGLGFCLVDGEVLEDDPSSIVDTILDGQYQIESMLGKGGMGAVFLARHILLGDRVAIKVLPPEMRSNSEWLRRFQREGQAARRFRHPNAVTVYDLRMASDGTIYMVMEYVEGHTLDAELKTRGSLSPAEALEILDPIMSVLNAAHAMGVVHRDLKPENIMIGNATPGVESNVKLLDLGIAKLREIAGTPSGGKTALTLAGQMLGTPYYMSPEQWGELPRDGDSEIDGRSDIYSLGLVFYEMIAGRRPYSAHTLLELRKEHVTVTPRCLDEVVPSVSHTFSDAIARAMAKDRADRPATASDLAVELKAALAGEPAVTMRQSAGTKAMESAATVMTLGGAPEVRSPAPTQPPDTRTSAQSADLASSITVPRAAHLAVTQPYTGVSQGSAPRRSKLPLVLGLLFLLLIMVGAGGFFALNWVRNRGTESSADTEVPSGNPTPAAESPSANLDTKELARYWVEAEALAKNAQSLHLAGDVVLTSGQKFKFHFTAMADGYLYIIGPGLSNEPTAFLTAKPPAGSGLRANHVQAGIDFSFPGGDEWLTLDNKPGTEDYTFIFSTKALATPHFLNEEATGNPLTATEGEELRKLLARYNQDTAVTELSGGNGSEPFVAVKVPISVPSDEPLILNVRFQHQ